MSSDAKRKYIRLDGTTWSEIEGLWESGDVTLLELEERYQISRRALQSHFAKRGLTKGAKAAQIAAAIKDRVFSETLPDVNETAARAKAAREAAYRNALVVEELIMAQLAAAQEDPSQAIKAASAIKALSLAAAGLERLHELKSRALGLDKGALSDETTVLVLQDLTQEEIDAMRERDEDDEGDYEAPPTSPDDENDIVVVDREDGDQGPIERSPESRPAGPRLVRGAT